MRIYRAGFGFLAGILVLSFGSAAPPRLNFFGCHDKPGQVLAVFGGTPGSHHSRNYSSCGSGRYSDDYAAQTRYRRPDARHATDYRSQHYWNDR